MAEDRDDMSSDESGWEQSPELVGPEAGRLHGDAGRLLRGDAESSSVHSTELLLDCRRMDGGCRFAKLPRFTRSAFCFATDESSSCAGFRRLRSLSGARFACSMLSTFSYAGEL